MVERSFVPRRPRAWQDFQCVAPGERHFSQILSDSSPPLLWIYYAVDLNGWVVPRYIVEPKIVCENENDVGLSVVLGPPLLLGEATVAEECHQEGDQHSSSQLILLNWKINF